MPVLRNDENPGEKTEENVTRRMVYMKNIMTTVLDIEGGPWENPGKPHSHIHEQITYIANGEILFFCEGEKEQLLKAGDLFYVPSNKQHCIQLISPKARLVDNFSPVREDFLN